jgi:2-polyprenyl-3-methyl-5-hydroxy-6-metoxy-1,4-benzoquinol methylase
MDPKAIDMAAGSSSSILYEVALEELSSLGLSIDEPILDVGCGSGNLLRRIAERGFKVLSGCDALERSAELPEACAYAQVDLNQKLPYADNSFSTIFSIEVIEHLENPRAHVREMHRLCKEGGTVILSTPNVESLLSTVSLMMRGYFNGFGAADYPAHITPLLSIDLERIFKEAKFEAWNIRYSGHGRVIKNDRHWQELLPFGLGKNLFRGKRFSDQIFIVAKKKKR